MEIKLISGENRVESLGVVDNVFVVNYKNLKIRQDSTIEVEFKDLDEYKKTDVKVGCSSCTTASLKRFDDRCVATIRYDTTIIGKFQKTVTFFYGDKNQKIKITGTVVR